MEPIRIIAFHVHGQINRGRPHQIVDRTLGIEEQQSRCAGFDNHIGKIESCLILRIWID
jgi:hypothetical protein